MSKDSIGDFLEDKTVKMAEIAFPSGNIPIYQEQQTSGNSGDLLQYAEPWGGAQNRPYANAVVPTDSEQDPSITRQGERPETFQNATPPEDAPVSTTNAWGQTWDKTPDPAAGDGAEPQNVYTKPRGDGSEPFETEIIPIGIGEPIEHVGDGEEQTFTNRVYVYASENNGEQTMPAVKTALIHKVVEAALKKGSIVNDNPHKMKVASLQDLYSFNRVSSDTLVHKSSKELWSISVDGEGSTVIEKQFDDNGNPIAG